MLPDNVLADKGKQLAFLRSVNHCGYITAEWTQKRDVNYKQQMLKNEKKVLSQRDMS